MSVLDGVPIVKMIKSLSALAKPSPLIASTLKRYSPVSALEFQETSPSWEIVNQTGNGSVEVKCHEGCW